MKRRAREPETSPEASAAPTTPAAGMIRPRFEFSLEEYARLYDSGPISYVKFDRHSAIRDLNTTAAEMLGTHRGHAIGMPLTVFFSAREMPRFLDHLRRCRESKGERVETELTLSPRHGREIPIQLCTTPFLANEPPFFLTALINIAGRKRAEAMLLESRDYAQSIVSAVMQPLVVLSPTLEVLTANVAFLKAFKLDETAIRGRLIDLGLYPPDASQLRLKLEAALVLKKTIRELSLDFDFPLLGKRKLLFNGQPLFQKRFLKPLLVLGVEDITRRIAAENEREAMIVRLRELTNHLESRVQQRTSDLEKANFQLRQHSARVFEAQETERRAVARELHDEVGQQITCLQILVQRASRDGPAEFLPASENLQSALADLLKSVRTLSSDLRPPVLDDFGLLPALKERIETYRERTGIKVDLNHAHFREEMLDNFLKNILYRVVQEGLTNVARHSGADKVSVTIKTRRGRALLEIRDRGSGFDMEKVSERGSMGLTSINERVVLAGGKLSINTRPGAGTFISAEFPLVSAQTDAFDSDRSDRNGTAGPKSGTF
jgi:PAS domain S-box-containing protein